MPLPGCPAPSRRSPAALQRRRSVPGMACGPEAPGFVGRDLPVGCMVAGLSGVAVAQRVRNAEMTGGRRNVRHIPDLNRKFSTLEVLHPRLAQPAGNGLDERHWWAPLRSRRRPEDRERQRKQATQSHQLRPSFAGASAFRPEETGLQRSAPSASASRHGPSPGHDSSCCGPWSRTAVGQRPGQRRRPTGTEVRARNPR